VTIPVDPIAVAIVVAIVVARVLDALGIVHTIGGSIASSIAGEPRHAPRAPAGRHSAAKAALVSQGRRVI